MTTVKNYAKDGKEIDLTGKVITESEFPAVYKVIEQIEREEKEDGIQV